MSVIHPAAFIVLEGLDCSGKTAQVKLLADWLRARGRNVLEVQDPGTTELGKMIRGILKDPANKSHITPSAELMLFAAARASMVDYLRSELRKDKSLIIVSDRYIHSTLAYQKMGRGIDHLRVNRSIDVSCYGFFATLTIYLDVDDQTMKDRMVFRNEGRDRFELESSTFRDQVRCGYEDAVRSAFVRYGDIIKVDGNGTREVVAEHISNIVTLHLSDRQSDYEELQDAIKHRTGAGKKDLNAV